MTAEARAMSVDAMGGQGLFCKSSTCLNCLPEICIVMPTEEEISDFRERRKLFIYDQTCRTSAQDLAALSVHIAIVLTKQARQLTKGNL
ncbi:MAG: hypothetical protein EOO38_31610 [Cytophagaceae bacterium]|nr:MAG: hypothetical protein EOO38_31610 [Cytophagaceae bacterium]